jgi:hypothetical protein
MATGRRPIQLSDDQIDFIRTSLNYSAKALRDQPYDPLEDRNAMLERRRRDEEMISSIKDALRSKA